MNDVDADKQELGFYSSVAVKDQMANGLCLCYVIEVLLSKSDYKIVFLKNETRLQYM